MAAGTALIVAGDEQLLASAARGDREALNELFGRYRSVAYRVAYRLLGNEADALDAVQDAFVKALTHLHGFEGRSSFKTWLLRVVSNTALDLGRRRGRRESVSFDAMWPVQREAIEPLVNDAAGRDLERVDLRRLLHEALDQLSPPQRQTFVLYAEAGLTYREVAGTLNVSVGTVMSRLFYARQKLRVLLEVRMQP
jgi:RNA polymerase sigma-70 factor (ECF subfamily)